MTGKDYAKKQIGNGDYQRIQLNECIKDQCVAYGKEDGKCHKYMNEVEND